MFLRKQFLCTLIISTILVLIISCKQKDEAFPQRVNSNKKSIDTLLAAAKIHKSATGSNYSINISAKRGIDIGIPIFSQPEGSNRGKELEDTIVYAIKHARKTICIEMFDLNDTAICNTLKKSKANIYMILNHRNWTKATHGPLQRRGEIHLAIGRSSGYYHAKILIVDSEAVYMGSYNYTEGATTRNTEVLQPLYGRAIAELYSKHFWREFKNADPKPLRHKIQ